MFKIFKSYQNLVALFSEKADGPMKFTDDQRNFQNRSKFLEKHNIDSSNLFIGRLEHTNNVVVIKDTNTKMFFECDGFVTNLPNAYLSFTVADCTAIYVFDPVNKAIGLLHVGWKGMMNDIIKNAINLMKEEYNSKPEDILIGVSPLMCKKCYEIQDDYLEHFRDYPNAFIYQDNKKYFDSKYVLMAKLLDLNIQEEHIEFINECTYCLKDKYFSYRRDQYGCLPDDRNAMIAIFGIKN